MASKGLDRKTVARVIAMRRKGVPWLEIVDKLGQPRSYVLKVRPLMKELDPSSVKASYERHTKQMRKVAGKVAPR
jgi:hypothetical protein